MFALIQGWKLAPALQPMAGDFNFRTVNMTCYLPEWPVEIINSRILYITFLLI